MVAAGASRFDGKSVAICNLSSIVKVIEGVYHKSPVVSVVVQILFFHGFSIPAELPGSILMHSRCRGKRSLTIIAYMHIVANMRKDKI
jgi:hypothetical protein